MNTKKLSLLIGLIISGVFIFRLHAFVLHDRCLDAGGMFDKANSTCMFGATSEYLFLVVTWPLALTYVVLGLVVMGVTSSLFNKLLHFLRLRGS